MRERERERERFECSLFLQREDWTERLKVKMSKRSKVNSKMALVVVQ